MSKWKPETEEQRAARAIRDKNLYAPVKNPNMRQTRRAAKTLGGSYWKYTLGATASKTGKAGSGSSFNRSGFLREAVAAGETMETAAKMLATVLAAGAGIVTVPTINVFDNPFNFAAWSKGTPHPGQPKRDRVIVDDAKQRTEAREARGLEVVARAFPSYTIRDHRKGIQNGADYSATSPEGILKMVDIKSGNVMSKFQVTMALQAELTGVEYWLVDPDNERAMRIGKNCIFEPTGYRVYPPQATAAAGVQ